MGSLVLASHLATFDGHWVQAAVATHASGLRPWVIATQTLVAVKGHQDAMAGMVGGECQKDDRAGTRIRIETVSLQKRKNEDEEQDFIKISNCILDHAAIKSI